MGEGLKIKKRYNRLSKIYDLMIFPLEKFFIFSWRRKVFANIKGQELLEVGVGTGKNFSYYPEGTRIEAIDFSEGMLDRALRKKKKFKKEINLKLMDVENLEYEDNRFDTIVATFVFCSVPNPLRGLQEIRRVCKAGGSLVFLEHLRPKSPFWGWFFDLLNPLAVRIMGSNINRDTLADIKQTGLVILKEEDLFSQVVKLVVARPNK